MGMSDLDLYITKSVSSKIARPTETNMSASEERDTSAAGKETAASNRYEGLSAVMSCPHDQFRKTARVALPSAEDEVSDNEVDIEDDAEDGDFLADFPDNTEVGSYSSDVMARWTYCYAGIGFSTFSPQRP